MVGPNSVDQRSGSSPVSRLRPLRVRRGSVGTSGTQATDGRPRTRRKLARPPARAQQQNHRKILLSAQLTYTRSAVVISVLVLVGAVAKWVERVILADQLAVPTRFVSDSGISGPLALSIGAILLALFGAVSLSAWIFASRGGARAAAAAVGLPLLAELVLYVVLGRLSEVNASYTSLYWTLIAMTLFGLAGIAAARHCYAASLSTYTSEFARGSPPWPAFSPQEQTPRSPGAPHRQRRVWLSSHSSPVDYCPLRPRRGLHHGGGRTGFGGTSATLGGATPRGAYLATPATASRAPDRLTLVFVDGSAVAFRPIARSTTDDAIFVPCGNATVRSLEGLELETLPSAFSEHVRVGSGDYTVAQLAACETDLATQVPTFVFLAPGRHP